MWFDSGSMPYAQVHYPFENAEWFDTHFPGDFIVEYIGQTRGWFYTMHVLATALFDRPGIQNLCGARHRAGQRRAEDEQVAAELPRRHRGVRPRRLRRDAVVPDGVADPARRQPDRHRAGHPRRCPPGPAAAVERYTFLSLYAPKKGTWRTDSANVLDRYILAKLAVLRDDLTESLDVCDISGGLRPIAPVHRCADELVCATVTFAVLGGRSRRHRHAAHRAGGDRQARCAAASAGHRGDLARA